MKRYRLTELPDNHNGHILKGIISGEYLCQGGIGFKKPLQRSHDIDCTCKTCNGKGTHIHPDDSEVFVILQGKAVMQINGKEHPLETGDVVVCEPGEDHHLVADKDDPCINLYLHAGPKRHKDQTG